MIKKLLFVLILAGGVRVMAQQPLGRSAAFIPTTAGSCIPEAYPNPTTLSLSNGIVFDTRQGEPALPANLQIASYPAGTAGYYIVQFDGPIYDEDKRLLATTGAEVCGYLPNYAYIVKLSAEAKNQLAATKRIGWIGIFQPAYKISPELDLGRSGLDTVLVIVFGKEPPQPVTDQLTADGGKILVTIGNKWRTLLKVAIAPDRLADIVRLPAVQWVEPFHEMHVDNAQAQWVLQTFTPDDRKIWDKGLKGQGQIVSTCDTGIRTSHDMFRDPSVPITDFGTYPTHRKIIGYQRAYPDTLIQFGDEGSASYHGTHTACTVCGNDSFVGGTNPNDGMAPEAKIFFLDATGPQTAIDAWPDYSFPIAYKGGARIISNSWGSTTRAYDAMCIGSDEVMWDNPDCLLLFSAGNSGPAGNTGTPANAKNVVTVGATQNGSAANQIANYSSIGPSGDGRMKPTVMAPGDLTSAYGGSDNDYVLMEGTSMACPVVAGNAALVRQYFTEGWYPTGDKVTANGFIPSAALLKAMLINSVETDFATAPSPSYRIGWGRPKLDNVLYFNGETRRLKVIDNTVGLETGMAVFATVNVTDATNPLRITLVWTDWPGSEVALRALVNDLNLEVTAPNGDVYKGNVFAGNQSKTGGNFDVKNVEENVFVDNPATGTWEIRIKANNVPFGPQPFALVVTGSLGDPMTALGISGFDCDDTGQPNPDHYPDPGETVSIKLNIKNSGASALSSVTGTLSSGSSAVTVLDNLSSYGAIPAGGSAGGDGFKIAISSSAKTGDTIPCTLSLTQTDALSRTALATLNFTLKLGAPRYPYADHDIGNVVLTVTEWGTIGFHDQTTTGPHPVGGDGFSYPRNGPNWLYLSSFFAGTDSTYVADRMYGNAPSNDNNTDWLVTTAPSGQVTIGQALVSDQDSRARFNDSGHPRPKGLEVYQRGFAWKNAPYNDFVILRYKLINKGSGPIDNLYAGIMADFDMPVVSDSGQYNKGGVDGARRLAYEKRTSTDNPHVGVMLLYPHHASNVSLLENGVYVYQGTTAVWHDTTAFKFLNGTINQTNGDKSTDWSVFVAAGPFNLPMQGEDTVAFAFVGGDNLAGLKANADNAQTLYDTLHFIEQPTHAVNEPANLPVLGFTLSPASPTPFSARTTIAYELPRTGPVTISVYNALGAKVKTLVNTVQQPGRYRLTWNGKDQNNRRLPTGIYFYRMQAEGFDKILKTVRVE